MQIKTALMTFLFGISVIAAPVIAKDSKDHSGMFITRFAHQGVAEINQAKLALQMAKNPDMQALAKSQLADHEALNKSLWALAEKKSVTLSDTVTGRQKKVLDKLSKINDRNREFDREYLKIVIENHRHAIKVLEKQAKSGTDADIKAFAAEALPVYKKHYDEAISFKGRLSRKSEE